MTATLHAHADARRLLLLLLGRRRRRLLLLSRALGVAELARDRKSTRLNSSHTEIYTLSLHDALPISSRARGRAPASPSSSRAAPAPAAPPLARAGRCRVGTRSEEHTSELQSHRDLHSFPTRRSSDLFTRTRTRAGFSFFFSGGAGAGCSSSRARWALQSWH